MIQQLPHPHTGATWRPEKRIACDVPLRWKQRLGTGAVWRVRTRGSRVRGGRSWLFQLKEREEASVLSPHIHWTEDWRKLTCLGGFLRQSDDTAVRSSSSASTDTPGNHAFLRSVSRLSQCISQNHHHSCWTFVWLSWSRDKWINFLSIKQESFTGYFNAWYLLLKYSRKEGRQENQVYRSHGELGGDCPLEPSCGLFVH